MVDDGGSLDVIVIGSGPIGLACAIEAKRRGLSCTVFDRGCLLQSLVNFPLTMTFFSTSEKLEIGGVPFVSHGPKPTRAEALEYYRRTAESWELDLRTYEEVTGIVGSKGDFTVTTGKGSYRSRSVIVATGFYGSPNRIGVPGEELSKVSHYYREPYPYTSRKLLVVGGGNSAADAALETFRKGAEVTLVNRGPSLDKSVKYWVRPDIENRIHEGSIKAYFDSTVEEIRAGEVLLSTPGGRISVENDFVLALTGYRPDYEFLERVGVKCSEDGRREPLHDEETFESSVPGIYLAGVICCGMESGKWLIENSRSHGPLIFDHIG